MSKWIQASEGETDSETMSTFFKPEFGEIPRTFGEAADYFAKERLKRRDLSIFNMIDVVPFEFSLHEGLWWLDQVTGELVRRKPNE